MSPNENYFLVYSIGNINAGNAQQNARRERLFIRKSGASPNNVELEFSYHDKKLHEDQTNMPKGCHKVHGLILRHLSIYVDMLRGDGSWWGYSG